MAKSIIVGVEKRKLASLNQFQRNANNGDVDAISESMEENGIFDALVVDVRSGDILSGNHRYVRMLGDGQEEAWCVLVQPRDDIHAAKINVAANATAKLSRYDDGMLADILSYIRSNDSLAGTGYQEHDYSDLLAKISPPSLQALEEKYGDVDDKQLWPSVRLPVPPKVFKTFTGLMSQSEGEEHEKFDAVLQDCWKYRDMLE